MTFEQRPEGKGGKINMSLWDKCVLGRGHSRGKGPKSLACSRTCRESREPCMEAASHTDLQLRAGCGYRSEGYQQTNIPGKCHAWALPLGASGEGSLLPQRMQILAPGWCLYDNIWLSWQLTPAPTSGVWVQSLVPRTKILHALG